MTESKDFLSDHIGLKRNICQKWIINTQQTARPSLKKKGKRKKAAKKYLWSLKPEAYAFLRDLIMAVVTGKISILN